MDRRGFLRNIMGSLAAIACPPIRAAKPLEPEREVVFKVTDLPADFFLSPDMVSDVKSIDELLRRLYFHALERRKRDCFAAMNEARGVLG